MIAFAGACTPRTVGSPVVLEPPFTPPTSGPFRALAVRHGFDLEPRLPDPAPAYVDPDGAFHPALTEPLAAATLHSWPTPAARAALASRACSEPLRFDPTDPDDVARRLLRFAESKEMEPEVVGVLHLLQLRSLLAHQQRVHRPQLPDPEAMLTNPDLDAFRHRRARLSDVEAWRSHVSATLAARDTLGGDPALGFERVLVRGAARWLAPYVAWSGLVSALGRGERIPEDEAAIAQVAAAVEAVSAAIADAVEAPRGLDEAALFGACLTAGLDAEERFLLATDAQPGGPVQARWMLAQQLRSMRDLTRFTRPHALELHALLRECDALRLCAHLAGRLAALRLWLADATGRSAADLEDALVALPDPPHPTTLCAGLGRLRGFVVLRRLRRGVAEGARELADAALRLAPGELAVRITVNDLHFGSGERSRDTLDSLRLEQSRSRSLTAALMTARVADAVDEPGRARAALAEALDRASGKPGAGPWLVLAESLLRSPPSDPEPVDALLATVPSPPPAANPLLHVLGASEPAIALDEARVALADLAATLRARAASRRALADQGKVHGWEKVARRAPIDPSAPDLCAQVSDRVADLRAAAPSLRQAPWTPHLRTLADSLSRAADLELAVEGAFASTIARLPAEIAAGLRVADPSSHAHDVAWTASELCVRVRAPRLRALRREVGIARARARAADRGDAERQLSELLAALAAAEGSPHPDATLDAVDAALSSLDGEPREAPGEAPLMTLHPDFDRFSVDELAIRPDALRRARALVRLFNEADGQRDRKRLRGSDARALFELRHRTRHFGGLRVFYRPHGAGWQALAAMSKYDDRPQRAAIARILAAFPSEDR